MLDISPLVLLAGVVIYLGVPVLVMLAIYWVARLAVRHELRRADTAAGGHVPGPGGSTGDRTAPAPRPHSSGPPPPAA